ncbi:hypothetical protein, conserved [Trypanosoma brucei gambiense DAL972]|uniref:Uncharacterized protein n=1 Tax=Trypanosoma brucei gambiense (strain MHOM/CI/86/DAL972) TaxID=679716 RepID=C9ZQD4_TRYB9|nr:hypothetical protein, conserved [Trypanosoma brucei gambiense DAL972]CBH11614.1 hypothetical protein, conserved [Trypanosoma brucei gambiense DAL972]|eukprot:XP_011773899.1 hypothetical protein, conserved [Trypanosoma brucei gambiense DAL972]
MECASQEFALLQHLKVSIPNDPVPPQPKAQAVRNTHRVMSPCRRPPVSQKVARIATAVNTKKELQAPRAPMAEFSGEVMTVVGKNNRPNVEYLIYDAKIPSRNAINMQLAEVKKQRAMGEKVRHRCHRHEVDAWGERDDAKCKQRLLKSLQEVNMEQAHRTRAEREAQQRRRMETEANGIESYTVACNALDPEKTIEGKKVLRDQLQQAAFESLDNHKKGEPVEGAAWDLHYEPFPWNNDTRRKRIQRDRCIALMDANRELAEKKRDERQRQRAMEAAWNYGGGKGVSFGGKRYVHDVGRNPSLQAARGSDDGAVEEGAAALSFGQPTECFFRFEGDNPSVRWNECRKLAEVNKQLAEQAERIRKGERLERIEGEKKFNQYIERIEREEKQSRRAEKLKRQKAMSMVTRDASKKKEGLKKVSSANECHDKFLLYSAHEREEKNRLKREQEFYDNLEKHIASSREAQRAAKDRALEEEKRLLQETISETKRYTEEENRKAKQKREAYKAALEKQIREKSNEASHSSPMPHRGPEVRVLYRCPVTKDLLPPEEFVPAASLRRTSTLW